MAVPGAIVIPHLMRNPPISGNSMLLRGRLRRTRQSQLLFAYRGPVFSRYLRPRLRPAFQNVGWASTHTVPNFRYLAPQFIAGFYHPQLADRLLTLQTPSAQLSLPCEMTCHVAYRFSYPTVVVCYLTGVCILVVNQTLDCLNLSIRHILIVHLI